MPVDTLALLGSCLAQSWILLLSTDASWLSLEPGPQAQQLLWREHLKSCIFCRNGPWYWKCAGTQGC